MHEDAKLFESDPDGVVITDTVRKELRVWFPRVKVNGGHARGYSYEGVHAVGIRWHHDGSKYVPRVIKAKTVKNADGYYDFVPAGKN